MNWIGQGFPGARMMWIIIIPGLPALAWSIVGARWLRREWIAMREAFDLAFEGVPPTTKNGGEA